MANYSNNKKSVGLKGGPNEYITHISDLFSVEGYKADSPDVNNPYNIIQSGNITMEGVDFPVIGTDNLGNRKLMTPGNNYQFPGNQVFETPMAQTGIEVPKRQGVRDNGDGSESTHLMRTETLDGENWFSFPTLFQNEDGTWVDMSISLEEPWEPVYQEALRRGEVIDFGTDKEAAIKFGEGSWKKKLKNGGDLRMAQEGFDLNQTSDNPFIYGDWAEISRNVNPATGDTTIFDERTGNREVKYSKRGVNWDVGYENWLAAGNKGPLADFKIEAERWKKSQTKNESDVQNRERTEQGDEATITGDFYGSGIGDTTEPNRPGRPNRPNGPNGTGGPTEGFYGDVGFQGNTGITSTGNTTIQPLTPRPIALIDQPEIPFSSRYPGGAISPRGEVLPNSYVDSNSSYEVNSRKNNNNNEKVKSTFLEDTTVTDSDGYTNMNVKSVDNGNREKFKQVFNIYDTEDNLLAKQVDKTGFLGNPVTRTRTTSRGEEAGYGLKRMGGALPKGQRGFEIAQDARMRNDIKTGQNSGADIGAGLWEAITFGAGTVADYYTELKELAGAHPVTKEIFNNIDPVTKISNALDLLSIPGSAVAEAVEGIGGLGDGEFNVTDIIPNMSGDFSFTNINNEPVKNVAGVAGVENPVGAFALNLFTDPSTYVGAGIAKNVLKKGIKTAVKQAPKYIDDVVKYLDDGAKYVDDYFSNVKPPPPKFTTEGLKAPHIVNKSSFDIDKFNISANDIRDIAVRTRERLLTDKFIKNNMTATGRTRQEVIESIDNFTNEFNGSVVYFDDLGTSSFGKGSNTTTSAVYNPEKITVNTNNIKGKTRESVLGSIEHEIEHMFSDIGKKGGVKYANGIVDASSLRASNKIKEAHPTLKSSDEMSTIDKQYFNLPHEQQVRFRKAIRWMEDNIDLKVGDDITDDHVEKLTFALQNWSREIGADFAGKGGRSDVYGFLTDLDPHQFLDEGQFTILKRADVRSKGFKKGLKDILNQTYGAIPAAGVGTVLANQKFGGEQLPQAQVGRSSSSTGTKPLLNFDNILAYISDTRGGTKEFWGNTADTVAFHESGAQQRMSALAKQISQKKDGTLYDGPARGVFQFEGPSLQTAQTRYKNIANAKGYELDSEIVNATSADELPIEKQYALFFANLIESDAKLADYPKGDLEQVDLWLQGHKNTEADGDRKSFQESVNEARKNGITGGYKSFKKQYGGGSYDGGYRGGTNPYENPFSYGVPVDTDVDETDIVEEEIVNILPSPYVIEAPVLEMDRDDQYQFERPTDQFGVDIQNLSPEELEMHYQQILSDQALIDQEYVDPTQVAGFVENANRRGLDYERGFEDFTERNAEDVKLLQLDLLDQGYDVGRTGVDGIYGSRTHGAYTSMIADAGLEESAISRYHKQYNPETYTEVKAIQSKLIEKGFLPEITEAGVTNIDGKFGDRTKMALVDYNTSISEEEEDIEGLVFENIPISLEEERCAAGMCQILELNEIQTEAIGVKHKDAWDLLENMEHSGNSTKIFNIYDDPLFDSIDENTSVSELKRITEKAKRKLQTTAQDYKVGDIVGMYYPGSKYHNQTLNSETHNTHSGFVSSISEDGTPIITHNMSGNIKNSNWDEVYTAWISRPNENITLNTTYAEQYEADDIENIQVDPRLINNFISKKERNLTSKETSIVTNIMRRADYNSKQIPEILNSSVDPEWLNAAIFGIIGVESGAGISTNPPPPRTRDELETIRGAKIYWDGTADADVSLGIGKTKFASIDDFARDYFEINSPADLADDNKAVDAVSYILVKNYELYKDYAQQFPTLGLTEEDIRNMTLISYNQGNKKLLTTGRNNENNRTSEEEISALRDLYIGDQDMYNSSNYRYIPGGRQLYDNLEGPSEGYISKTNRYITEVYGGSDDENNRLLALNNQDNQPIQVLAKGGEYGVFKNYMNGEYNNTSRLNFAEGVFDKLNRKHYKDAKSSGMSAPNYIMSYLVG